MCGQQKGQSRAKSHVRLTLQFFFFLEFHGFRFKSAIPRLFRDRGKSLALEFGSGSLNKFHFVVHFKSTVSFFHGNGNEVLGVKGPPTN